MLDGWTFVYPHSSSSTKYLLGQKKYNWHHLKWHFNGIIGQNFWDSQYCSRCILEQHLHTKHSACLGLVIWIIETLSCLLILHPWSLIGMITASLATSVSLCTLFDQLENASKRSYLIYLYAVYTNTIN